MDRGIELMISNPRKLTAIVAACFIAMLMGCNRSNPYLTSQTSGFPAAPPISSGSFGGNIGRGGNAAGSHELLAIQQRYEARESELNRRLQALDENNRQLQTQLAQSQQQIQIAADERTLLKRQLMDVSGQLQQTRVAGFQTENELRGISDQFRSAQVSTQSRGGARLTANKSLKEAPEFLKDLGFAVLEDGELIRIRIPVDQLFEPSGNTLTSGASSTLERIAAAIQREYPKQRVAVEGHTDSGPFYGGNYTTPQQLSSAQSTAVVDFLVRRNALPASQLFSLAHADNHPIANNDTPVARSQNRRIEFVIYPDTFR
jgi:flagellar motor protein MotB